MHPLGGNRGGAESGIPSGKHGGGWGCSFGELLPIEMTRERPSCSVLLKSKVAVTLRSLLLMPLLHSLGRPEDALRMISSTPTQLGVSCVHRTQVTPRQL